MAIWPEPENRMIPEGHYTFRLSEEPDFEEWDYTDKKTGKPRVGRKIILQLVGKNDGGEFEMRADIPVWDTRYAELCGALHVDHGRDIEMAGAEFEADVYHEADNRDPSKSWPRLKGIKAVGGADDETEIPF